MAGSYQNSPAATDAAPKRRFVVLHHQLSEGEHWDLMLEYEGVLLTWQLPSPPASRAALPIPARRIADHRLVYLDYQGPVGGDRGSVARYDTGPLVVLSMAESVLRIRLEGKRLSGGFELRRTAADDRWTLDADRGSPTPERDAPARHGRTPTGHNRPRPGPGDRSDPSH